MSMIAVGTLVGPPLSGVFAHHFGLRAPFLAAAVFALIDGILRLVFVKPLPPVTDDPVGPLAVLRVPGSASVTGLVALSGAAFASIEPVLPRYLANRFHLDPWGIGWASALLVLVVAVLSPMVGSRVETVSARHLVLIGVGIAALGMTTVGLSTHPWHVLAGLVLLGMAVPCFSAPASILIGMQGMQTTPPALGGTYSLYNLAYAFGLMAAHSCREPSSKPWEHPPPSFPSPSAWSPSASE